MRYSLCAAALAALVMSGVGCSHFDYKGTSPTARTFTDSPAAKDYYVGIHASFALDDAPPRQIASTPDDIPLPVAAVDRDMMSHSIAAGDSTDARP